MAISTVEAINILSRKRIAGDENGVWAKHGRKVHKILAGAMRRISGSVIPGLEENLDGPLSRFAQDNNVYPEVSTSVALGNGTLASCRIDCVFGTEFVLEIKSADDKNAAGFRWLQLALNAMLWSLANDGDLSGRLMYFYNTGNLFLLEGGGGELFGGLAYILQATDTLKSTQEKINENRRNIKSPRDQRWLLGPTREEGEQSFEYLQHLGQEQINLRKQLEAYCPEIIRAIYNGAYRV